MTSSISSVENFIIGRVYRIFSKSSKFPICYIGSTIKTLEERFSGHKRDYNNYLLQSGHYKSSFVICMYPDCEIEKLDEIDILINEKGEYDSTELRKIEKEYIDKTNLCVNKLRAYRSYEELREDSNKNKKKYRKRLDIREKEKIYNKKWNIKKLCNICNVYSTKTHWNRHCKTKIHQDNKKYIEIDLPIINLL